jgi:hypothetical protein
MLRSILFTIIFIAVQNSLAQSEMPLTCRDTAKQAAKQAAVKALGDCSQGIPRRQQILEQIKNLEIELQTINAQKTSASAIDYRDEEDAPEPIAIEVLRQK